MASTAQRASDEVGDSRRGVDRVLGARAVGARTGSLADRTDGRRDRDGHAGVRGVFVQVESRMSMTGASADEWVAIRPGTEGILALGLAYVWRHGDLEWIRQARQDTLDKMEETDQKKAA